MGLPRRRLQGPPPRERLRAREARRLHRLRHLRKDVHPLIRVAPESLLRNRDFVNFWTGETISLLGSQVTFLALPLTAVLVLNVSPVELGLLSAAEFAPFLLISLPAGVIVDRVRRRPILIAANLARAVFVGLVPLLA